ncbi:TPA_asm: M [Glycyrrhiza betacytorhabdovirus 1]|nr:TPA_asm: M [Glycyrrhiza betacytorhabdovirus 1]
MSTGKPTSPRNEVKDLAKGGSTGNRAETVMNPTGVPHTGRSEQTDIAASRFQIIPDSELKIKYCGIISTFRGFLIGKNKEQILEDYLDVLTYVLGEKSKASGVSESDTLCIMTILKTLMRDKIGKSGTEKLMTKIPHHILFGKDAWMMEIDFPQMINLRVQTQPSSEYQIDLAFKENVVENRKLKYIFEGSGGILVWKIPQQQVCKLYRLSSDYLFPETVMNKEMGNEDSLLDGNPSLKKLDHHPSTSENMSYIPDEQKILNDAFMRAKRIVPSLSALQQ